MQNWGMIEKVKQHVQPLVDELIEDNANIDLHEISGNILNAAVTVRRSGCPALKGAMCVDCSMSGMTMGRAVCDWLTGNPLDQRSTSQSVVSNGADAQRDL